MGNNSLNTTLNSEALTEPQKHTGDTLTPFDRFVRRISKEFITKKYIGDIYIDDTEYEMLIDDFRGKYILLADSYNHRIIDIPFAVTLVQIGIKYYDGGYWPHVRKVLGMENIPINHQTWIGDSFVDTLKKYQKLSLPASEKVKNILMHGFISDNYANNFFDFLFEYYRIDLDRDMERNTSENMNALIEAMIKKDHTSRMYLLVQQTSDAIANNIRGSIVRIRHFLKLIEKCSWDRDAVINGRNRLTVLFNNWRSESSSFENEYSKYHVGHYSNGGEKSFSSPYLTCDLRNIEFLLVLPPQLVKITDESINFRWEICIGERSISVPINYYEAITGYKTEKTTVKVYDDELFSTIKVQLMNSKNKVRSFGDIGSDCVRFFDADGNYLKAETLPASIVYSFTEKGSHLFSSALVDSETCGFFLLSYFNFQTGDTVKLPDGNVISIGKKSGKLHHAPVRK